MNVDTHNPREQAKGFLPDFCQIRVTLAVIIAAELFAIILCIARFKSFQGFWLELGTLSLYVQWVVLPLTLSLCVLKKWLEKQSILTVGVISMLTLLMITMLVALIAYERVLSISVHESLTVFMLQSLLISFLIGLIILHYFYLQYQLNKQQRAEADARFDALQARIRPHFLFNSMNIIANLTRTDPRMAENVVVDLADLFRAAITESSRPVPIADELSLAEGYLNIEKMRLGGRLQIQWQTDPAADNFLIPTMMIQPLLENAIYHGIERIEGGGTVGLRLSLKNDLIHIEVFNNLPDENKDGETRKHQGNHLAQHNISQRLQSFFGETALFSTMQSQQMYRVVMQFKAVTESVRDSHS